MTLAERLENMTYEEKRELIQDVIDLIFDKDSTHQKNNIAALKRFVDKRKRGYIEVDGTRIYCTEIHENLTFATNTSMKQLTL